MQSSVSSALPLSYGISLLVQLGPLPYHVFNSDNHYVEKFDSNDPDKRNVLKTDFSLRVKLLNQIRAQKVALICDESPVIFAGVQCLDGITVLIGPVVMTKVDQNFAKLYSLKHQADTVPLLYCDPGRLCAAVLLIYTELYGRHFSVNDLLDANFISPEVLQLTQQRLADVFSSISLEERPHNPVTLELNIRRAIRSGDEAALKTALNSPYSAMRGTLADTELRSAQNLAIVDITIYTREAIDCGLSVEELYILADAYIQQIEECRFPAECAALARSCALKCTQLVAAAHKRQLHPDETSASGAAIVKRALDYIDRHLYEKTDISSMAARLKVSSGYLAHIFRRSMGMTISAFARRRKMELAVQLLTGSDKSLQEIAQMLGFSSQSHFGQVFMRATGETPGQYRARRKH